MANPNAPDISPEALSWTVFYLTGGSALLFIAAVVIFILLPN